MRKKYIAIECENSKYCKDVPYISKKEFRKNEDNVIVGKTRLKKYKSSSEKKELDLLLFDNKEFEVKEKIFGFKKGYVFVGDNNFITLKRRIPFLLIFFIILTASVVFACTHPPKQEEDKPIEPLVQNEVIIPEEIKEEDSFSIDFSELKKMNSDVVGWIVIEGTQVNYPIVQSKDNSYYLNHSFDKTWNSLGSIFMDYRSTNDFSDYNTFIYGHHTKNGSMFGELYKYMDASFYKEHPFFYLYSPNGNYRIEIISAYLDSAESDSYVQDFDSVEDYERYINLIIKKSNYITDTLFDVSTDKIITLYSCSHESNRRKEDRYFIHGKILKI